ncbi:c-type cytochrome [Candidatus Magnetobacterium casense]|uniref:C-type cytochrome n=1 Tax=Candidatus Magnetobacterium casense TaxID=1455061 RepID=A0ABS6RXP3_9BACT|nr:c-type cytochrome [Candidatus Magnetobacterium casensis]MBV6340578.1 c-type cytochrome [Candidatus Magnetobacterium casensis]
MFIHSEMSPQWKPYQLEYRDLAIANAKDADTKKTAMTMDIEVKQIYLGGLKRIDRCTSCHIGVENPMMAKALLPLKAHSGPYLKNHPSSKFGCTICHNGQGRAVDMKNAHGLGHDTHWDLPILPLKYIQSACASCHDSNMLKDKGGDKVVKGEVLFRERGCKGCHKLNGVGGVIGKALDGVGSQPVAYFPMKNVRGDKTVYSWMKEHFDDPRNIVSTSEMKSDFTDEETDQLTTYVLSLHSDEIPKKYRRFLKEPEVPDTGEYLYKMYCGACHASGKDSVYDEVFKRTIPSIENPSFLKAVDRKYLKTVIEEGRAGTQMTAWKSSAAGLTNAQIDKIVDYIIKDKPAEASEAFDFAAYKPDIRNGEELYRVRCVSCHGKKGEGGVGLNLRNPVVQKGATAEFLAITLRDGREGTHMAAFGPNGAGLTNENIADVVAYVKTLSTKK